MGKQTENSKNKSSKKMIIVILIVAVFSSLFIWNKYVENAQIKNFKIPESSNIEYDIHSPSALAPGDIISQIDLDSGKPILLYIYTSWCGVCKKETPIINEIARKFQNTDLKVIAVAIDKNFTAENLANYLNDFGKIYFKPSYLIHSDGLADLLKQKSINYNRRIPLVVTISKDGEVTSSSTGYKSEEFVTKKIIKML